MMNIDIKTADGEEIELGGTYYDEKGTRYRVTGIRVPDHQVLAKSKLYCMLPLRRRWPEGLLVRWRRPEPCEGDGCGLLEREGKR